MCKIGSSRLCRCLICLLLVGCFLIYSSPLRAHATAAVAPAIVDMSLATGNPWIIVGGLLIGLGVYAGVQTGAFESLTNSAVDFLDSSGNWLKDGSIELLRTVDSAGTTAYYAAGDLLETLRGWLWDTKTIDSGIDVSSFTTNATSALAQAQSNPNYVVGIDHSSRFVILWSKDPIIFQEKDDSGVWLKCSGEPLYYWHEGIDNCVRSQAYCFTSYTLYQTGINDLYHTTQDLTLGYLPSQETQLDDETVVTFHPYLANVIRTRTGGSGDDGGEPENKWWLGLAFADSLQHLYETNQKYQIETPSVTEIPDITIGIQFDFTENTDDENKKYYVMDPIISTNPGTGTDTDTKPGTGTNTGTDTGTDSGGNSGSDSGSSGSGGSWTPPSGHAQFALGDLSKFFPFCIPFDLFKFFKLLNAEPEAPVLYWEMKDLAGKTYSITIDLSEWNSVASLFRTLQLFLFVTGLAAASRKFIKW